ARETHHETQRRQADAAAALTRALQETGFADADAAAAAQLPEARVAELEQQVTAHTAASARVREGLAEAAIASLTGSEAPAVEEAATAHSAQHDALIEATTSAAQAAAWLEQLQRCQSSLRS